MKVLQVHTRYRQRGGEDAVVEADAMLLREAGHEVLQYLVDNPSGSVPATVSLLGSAWNRAVERKFDNVLKKFAPDVVHVHNTWFACSPSPLRAARIRRVPTVMTVHNFRLICANGLFLRDGKPCEKCLSGTSLNAIKYRCYRDSRILSGVAAAGIGLHRRNNTWAELVGRFITLSSFATGKLASAGIPTSQVTIGSNFVSDPGPRIRPPSMSEEVLFVGRLSREKGVATLMDAWREAMPSGLRLCVVGGGPERELLEAGSPPNVSFIGTLASEEVRRRISGARAVVIPSIWYEGQPVVALEALSSGTPLVMSRIGGLPEILGEREAGWLCEPGRVDELATALHALQEANEVDARGAAARSRYEESFTGLHALDRLETVYEELTAA